MSQGDDKSGQRSLLAETQQFISIPEAMRWTEVWLRAIALSWNEPGFAARFVADPAGVLRARADLAYRLPRGVVLRVQQDGKWSRSKGGWSLPPTRVVMKLPPRPSQHEAIAFTTYAETTAFYLPSE